MQRERAPSARPSATPPGRRVGTAAEPAEPVEGLEVDPGGDAGGDRGGDHPVTIHAFGHEDDPQVVGRTRLHRGRNGLDTVDRGQRAGMASDEGPSMGRRVMPATCEGARVHLEENRRGAVADGGEGGGDEGPPVVTHPLRSAFTTAAMSSAVRLASAKGMGLGMGSPPP